jgi:hypothetical protein
MSKYRIVFSSTEISLLMHHSFSINEMELQLKIITVSLEEWSLSSTNKNLLFLSLDPITF